MPRCITSLRLYGCAVLLFVFLSVVSAVAFCGDRDLCLSSYCVVLFFPFEKTNTTNKILRLLPVAGGIRSSARIDYEPSLLLFLSFSFSFPPLLPGLRWHLSCLEVELNLRMFFFCETAFKAKALAYLLLSSME